MAEWLGHVMANWPTWAIGLGVIVVIIGGVLYYFADATFIGSSEPHWRKHHGKK